MDSGQESHYFSSNSPHHKMPLLHDHLRSTSPANTRPEKDRNCSSVNSLNIPVRPSPPPPSKPEVAKPYIPMELYPGSDMYKDKEKHHLGDPMPYSKGQDQVSKTRSSSQSTIEDAEAAKKSKREKCWRGMMICQFVMILLIFLFILALSIGIGYIALTVKDAVDRADHAIHNNPVTNFVDRMKNLKNSVSQSVQKMKGSTQPG